MPKASKKQLSSQKASAKSQERASKPEATEQRREIASAAVLKKLADNDEQVRADTVSLVGRLLKTKTSLEAFDLQKLWKGLWYSMWHSDTPANQQALARELADLFAEVNDKNYATFLDAFWTITLREWESLDKHRINKYYMLVRFVFRSMLMRLKADGWKDADLEVFQTKMVDEAVGPLSYANPRSPHSLRLHIIDIFVDELDTVLGDDDEHIPDPETLEAVLTPVLSQLGSSAFKHIKQRVKDEVVSDDRLVKWQLVDDAESEEDDDESNEGASDGSSDWEGFD